MIGKRRATLLLLLIFCVSIPINMPKAMLVKAEPKTIVVPDEYSSIQQAIDNAIVGDTVFVKSGTYHENLIIDKSLSLVGENVDTTIIDGNPPEGYRIPIKIESDNVSVSGIKLLYGYAGITVGEVKYCSISGNRIAGNQHGIKLVGTSLSNVIDNYFEQIRLSSAIQLSYSNYNLVAGNYINNCTEGIQIWQYSTNNTVTENTIKNCDDVAIRLQYADNNTVTRNDVSNSGTGTSIYVANNNTIAKNNYINNIEHFPSGEWEWYAKTFGYEGSQNIINQNYFSNYNGTDTDKNGIGETPYSLDNKNQDNYPLMNPINIFDAGIWEWTPYNVFVFSNSSVSDFSFIPENTMIQFNVEGENGTTGFCSVTILKSLLNTEENWTVLVDSNSVTPTVNEDTINTYLHFTYNHNTKTIEIIGTNAIPEFPSWITLPLLLIATMVVTVTRNKLIRKKLE